MEVEIKHISLDARLEYLQEISENPKTNVKKFPWVVAVVAVFIGGAIAYGIDKYRKRKQKRDNS